MMRQMMGFFKRHKGLHIWLLAELTLLAAFFAARTNRSWMNAFTKNVAEPFRRTIGEICYLVDFSVAEVLCILLAVASVAYLLGSIIVICKAKGQRGRLGYRALLGAVCAALTIYSGVCYLWGVQYYADGFQQKSGITAQAVSVEDLSTVTQYFAHQLAEASEHVERDKNGLFAVPREDVLARSTAVYNSVSDRFPFLAFSDKPPKAVSFSQVMSQLDFTGVYCPFTGESNVNMDSPASFLPSTIAHELAHQRGISSEQECNFIAILASTTSGIPEYVYSGLLLGYVHLGNALHAVDYDQWQQVYRALPEKVQADLRSNNEYWAKFQDAPAKKVSNKVYDRFLKGYGDVNGLKSYGTVVDLLVAYYK